MDDFFCIFKRGSTDVGWMECQERKWYVHKDKKYFIYHRSISHQLRQLFLLKLWKEHWNSLTTLKKKVLQLRMILLLRRLLCRCKPPKHQHMIKCLLHWELFIWAVFPQCFRKVYCWIGWSLYSQRGKNYDRCKRSHQFLVLAFAILLFKIIFRYSQ